MHETLHRETELPRLPRRAAHELCDLVKEMLVATASVSRLLPGVWAGVADSGSDCEVHSTRKAGRDVGAGIIKAVAAVVAIYTFLLVVALVFTHAVWIRNLQQRVGTLEVEVKQCQQK